MWVRVAVEAARDSLLRESCEEWRLVESRMAAAVSALLASEIQE